MIDRDTFSALAPVLGPEQKMAMPPSSTVHGGQHDTEYVTFELLLHAAFVADETWHDMLEPDGMITPHYTLERSETNPGRSGLVLL